MTSGEPGPLPGQPQLGDFMIPQRGILVIGGSFFEAFDEARHLTTVTRGG